jgi:hypothetical protein
VKGQEWKCGELNPKPFPTLKNLQIPVLRGGGLSLSMTGAFAMGD